jgi:rhodanese-related sulfurtransferase
MSNNDVQYREISPQDARMQLGLDKNIILLDVRTLEEYNEAHIPSSILIPLDTLSTQIQSKIIKKDSKIFVYCKTGRRSETAAKLLISMGYTNVYDLGGIINWGHEM